MIISIETVLYIYMNGYVKRVHIAKLAIFENNRLTIGEQKNAIQNMYNQMLTEFCLMFSGKRMS